MIQFLIYSIKSILLQAQIGCIQQNYSNLILCEFQHPGNWPKRPICSLSENFIHKCSIDQICWLYNFNREKNIELAKYGSGVRWCFFNTCFWHTARCKHGSLNIQIYGDLQICAKFTNSNLQLQIWEANVFNTS